MKSKVIKLITAIILIVSMAMAFTSCAWLQSEINELNGSITGNTYDAMFYSNDGELFMTMRGEKIQLNANVVKEHVYNDGSWGYVETLSSVVTITIDGSQVENCGSTVIFAESGLKPDVNYQQEMINIDSEAHGIGDNTIVANVVNEYKNKYGKPVVVVIQSQLGNPICAFSGKKVYWEVCEDLPKTTKLMIDGKALYIHRANFQIIDKDLLI